MTDRINPIEVPLVCLHHGCEASGPLRLHPSERDVHGYGITPPSGWLFYALGYPSTRRNLGLCPAHQNIVLEGSPSNIGVKVTQETHGIFFEVSTPGSVLGKVTFPSNTMTLQRAQEVEPSEELWAAGRRVANQYGFAAPTT
jgi:hypothetical protein